jgi:hypothetical protein
MGAEPFLSTSTEPSAWLRTQPLNPSARASRITK